jgi:hypothetical protein
VDSKSDGWEQTLVRFRAQCNTLIPVHNGQPSGWIVPEKALATINEFIKEDLKRSVSDFFYCVFVHLFTNLPTWQQPLYDTKAAQATRARDGEKYLEGLLPAIRRLGPVPVSGGSQEYNTKASALSACKCSFALPQCDVMS